MTATPTADELFEEASGWYFRLLAEDVTPAEMENFAAWLGQGQAQDDAWQEVQALLGGLREPARVVRRAEQAAWRKPARRWAYAAAVLLAVGLTVQNTPWLDRLRADYATGTGESRTVELADGSQLQLNTDSAIQVRMSGGERQIRLLRGEGFFSVTKDPTRPFVVQSGDGWVKVVGTQFSVARRDAQTRVLVAQG